MSKEEEIKARLKEFLAGAIFGLVVGVILMLILIRVGA